MSNGEKIIGKIENGFELITKVRNMRLHLEDETLRNNTDMDILSNLMQDAYYDDREVEIIFLTKSDIDREFVFITLTTEEAKADILGIGLTFNSERLKVSIIKDKNVGKPSELRISTTLVANNLIQRESQSTIIKSFKRLFGEENVTGVTFGYKTKQEDDRQAGWCHIQYLNTAVYTK